MLLLLLLLGPILQGESQVQISGRVINANDIAVPFVNVILYQSHDSSMVNGVVTDTAGNFELESSTEGTHYLTISALGYSDVILDDITIDPISPTEIQDIILTESFYELEGVEIRSSRMKHSNTKEGMIINVQSSILTKGSTILQLIERSPGVIIDRREGDLKLNGQSGTLIMINGKSQRIPIADLLQMLNGMDANNVEQIELISNPSAKYDAEGGAIINIKMGKSELEGTNGSLTMNIGKAWGRKIGTAVSINHVQKAINIFGNYSFNLDDSFSDWHAVGSSISPPLGGYNIFDFLSQNSVKNKNHNALVGLEYTSRQKLTIGMSASYNVSAAHLLTNNRSFTGIPDNFDFTTYITRIGQNKWKNGNGSISLKKKLNPTSNLGIDLDYISFQIDTPNEINNEFLNEDGQPIEIDNIYYSRRNRGTSSTIINLNVLQIDYNTEITPEIKIEGGIKASFSTTQNSAAIQRYEDAQWVIDERSESKQKIKELIGASYVSLDYNIQEQFEFNLGLRYEAWDRDFSNVVLNRKFGRLFPSAFITYKIGAFSSLQLAYNKRIARPTFNDLASYLSYNGPTAVATGNSTLLATITDKAKLTFLHGGKNISLVYSHEAHPIARYQIASNDAGNIALITPQNIVFQNSYGIETYTSLQLTENWDISWGGSLMHRHFEVTHTVLPKKKSYIAYNFNANTSWRLPKSFSMEVSGWYVGPHYNGSIRVEGFGVIDLGIKKDFGSKYGTLQLSINDLLQSMKIRSFIGDLTEEAFQSKAEVFYSAETGKNRLIRLSYYKSFGSKTIKSKPPSKMKHVESQRIITD